MYSGIGPKEVFETAGVTVKDHAAGLATESFLALHTDVTFNETSYEEYIKYKTGPTGKSNGLVLMALKHFDTAFNKTNKALLAGYSKQLDILVKQIPGTTAAVGDITMQLWGLSAIANNKPLSRDADVMVALTRYNRKHWASSALAKYQPVETAPGPQYQSDVDIIQGGIESASLQPTFAYPSVGSSMMPEDLGGYVSDELLVYGVEKLSVVDASIKPLIPAARLHATMYAIAEKAADVIKAELDRARSGTKFGMSISDGLKASAMPCQSRPKTRYMAKVPRGGVVVAEMHGWIAWLDPILQVTSKL